MSTNLLATPQEGVDGSGGVGGFAKPPMVVALKEESSSTSSTAPATATTTTTTPTATANSPQHHKCLLKDSALDKFCKNYLPNTSLPDIYLMPNTKQALLKIMEHFTMLLTFVSTDMCEHNERSMICEQDVVLALKEIGMEQLVAPLQQALYSAKPRKPKTARKAVVRVGIQLDDLIRKGLIQPGKGVLRETYQDQVL